MGVSWDPKVAGEHLTIWVPTPLNVESESGERLTLNTLGYINQIREESLALSWPWGKWPISI